jgi:hypothetical protein
MLDEVPKTGTQAVRGTLSDSQSAVGPYPRQHHVLRTDHAVYAQVSTSAMSDIMGKNVLLAWLGSRGDRMNASTQS